MYNINLLLNIPVPLLGSFTFKLGVLNYPYPILVSFSINAR